MKNYNKDALRGLNVTDEQFAQDLMEVGVNVPDELLHTPDLVPYVINEFYKQNVKERMNQENPATPGTNYTEAQAQKRAEGFRQDALNSYKELLKSTK